MKTQSEVKDCLLRLKKDVKPFTVIFSGKSSRKVHGLYKPDDAEIIIHNRNFTTDEQLMYTAIHEFAHHIHFTAFDGFVKGAHNSVFKNIMHDLLEDAQRKGIYVPEFRKDYRNMSKQLYESISDFSKKMAIVTRGYKVLAGMLFDICRQSKEIGFVFEDFIDRELCLKNGFINTIIKGYQNGVTDNISFEKFLYCSKIKKDDVRQMALNMFNDGKSKEQIEATLKPEKYDVENVDIMNLLIDEKQKTEKKISKGINALETIEEKIKEYEV